LRNDLQSKAVDIYLDAKMLGTHAHMLLLLLMLMLAAAAAGATEKCNNK